MASSQNEPWFQYAGWWNSTQFFFLTSFVASACSSGNDCSIGTIVFWIETMGLFGFIVANTADGYDVFSSSSWLYCKVSLKIVGASGGNENNASLDGEWNAWLFFPLHPLAEKRYLCFSMVNLRQLINCSPQNYVFECINYITFILGQKCHQTVRLVFQILHRTYDAHALHILPRLTVNSYLYSARFFGEESGVSVVKNVPTKRWLVCNVTF